MKGERERCVVQEQEAWFPPLRPGSGQGDIQELCHRDQETRDWAQKAGGRKISKELC